MQYKITHSKEYKKDIRKLNHQRLESLEIVIDKLANGKFWNPTTKTIN